MKHRRLASSPSSLAAESFVDTALAITPNSGQTDAFQKLWHESTLGFKAAPEESGMGGMSLVGGIRLLVAEAVGVQHSDHALRIRDHPLGH